MKKFSIVKKNNSWFSNWTQHENLTKAGLVISVILSACFFGCQGNTPQSEAGVTETPSTGQSYPSITDSIMVYLWENCDFIDYIFYTYDFSLSQGERPAIQASLNHISREVPVIDENCRSIGRIFYQVEGVNVMEADIVIGEQCQYYIFYENGKKTYANKLSVSGIAFFNGVFQQFGRQQSTPNQEY